MNDTGAAYALLIVVVVLAMIALLVVGALWLL